MGNGEREDENRRLAEWLGFRFELDSTNADFHQWHHPDCKCTSKSGPDKCLCVEGCYWGSGAGDEPPDFRTDEAANAMLLEKMRSMHHTNVSLSKQVKICIRFKWKPRRHQRELIYAQDPDRKTAIVLAALALLNERATL